MKENFNRRSFLTTLGLSAAGFSTLGNPFQNNREPNIEAKEKNEYSEIKITGIKTFKIKRAILVKVETNIGITGWGESSPNSTDVIEAFIHSTMKELLLGQNPFNVEPIWDQLYWVNQDLGPSGALPYAIAGIDLALWDIKGKLLKQPVYNLLGGHYRKEITAYGSIPLYSWTVPVEEAINRCLKLVDKGFKVIKLRMQIREYNLNPIPDHTAKYYEAIRKAVPENIEIFVDPNEGYTAARAIQVGKELVKLGMNYFESPCPLEDHRDTAAVVEALDIPVLAGEKCYTRWQFRDLILEANPDFIQPDVIKSGGITEVKKIAALGQAFFKPLIPHNTKPTLGTAAALHLMCSISNAGPFIEFVETGLYEEVMSVFDVHVDFKDGKLIVPEEPGLGLVVNERRLEKLAG